MSNFHIEPQNNTFSYVLMLAAFGSIVPKRVYILRRLPPAAWCYLLRLAVLNIRRLQRRASKSLAIKSALAHPGFIFEWTAFRFVALTHHRHLLSHSNLNLWLTTRSKLHAPTLYLRNGWTNCVQTWCAVRDLLRQ